MGNYWYSRQHNDRPLDAIASSDRTADASAIVTAQLITAHTPLVRRLALQLHRRIGGAVDLDDLVQTGMVALVEAAGQWQDRGLAFSGYAQTRVRGAMIDCLRRGTTLGRAAIVRRKEVDAVRVRLMGRLLRMPTDAEMAAELCISPREWLVVQAGIEPAGLQPIDQAIDESGDSAFTDPTDPADLAMIRAQGAELLARAIATLPERQALVLQLYFVEELALDEIGTVLGVGAARICQIKKTALERLRKIMLERDPDE